MTANRLYALLAPLWRGCAGSTAIEYALIALFIAIVIIASLISIGTSLSGFFQQVAAGL